MLQCLEWAFGRLGASRSEWECRGADCSGVWGKDMSFGHVNLEVLPVPLKLGEPGQRSGRAEPAQCWVGSLREDNQEGGDSREWTNLRNTKGQSWADEEKAMRWEMSGA